jgi:hypothetical protein
MRSHVFLAADLRALLLCFSDLADLFRTGDVRFVTAFDAWLKDSQDTLKRHGVPESARLAGFRSRLFAAPQDERGRRPSRKRQMQLGGELLFDAQEALQEIYKPVERRLDGCRDVIRPLLDAIRRSAAVKYAPAEPFDAFLDAVWNVLNQHEQLKTGMLPVLALLSAVDARLLVAEVLELQTWPR